MKVVFLFGLIVLAFYALFDFVRRFVRWLRGKSSESLRNYDDLWFRRRHSEKLWVAITPKELLENIKAYKLHLENRQYLSPKHHVQCGCGQMIVPKLYPNGFIVPEEHLKCAPKALVNYRNPPRESAGEVQENHGGYEI